MLLCCASENDAAASAVIIVVEFSCRMYSLQSICTVNVLVCCAAEHVEVASV